MDVIKSDLALPLPGCDLWDEETLYSRPTCDFGADPRLGSDSGQRQETLQARRRVRNRPQL